METLGVCPICGETEPIIFQDGELALCRNRLCRLSSVPVPVWRHLSNAAVELAQLRVLAIAVKEFRSAPLGLDDSERFAVFEALRAWEAKFLL